MSEYYNRQGVPIDRDTWARSFRRRDEKRVAFDDLELCHVSTVWLGLNHQYGDGPPLIFETMVFGGPLDQECQRYSTEDEAISGHRSMVERAKTAGVAK